MAFIALNLLVIAVALVVVFNGVREQEKIVNEKPSQPKDLKEVMEQMQGEELLKQALTLTAQNNYTEAFPILEKAASLGNTEAMCLLGELYAEGKGVDSDLQKSYEYYTQAAEKSHPKAQYKLGIYYLEGKGTTANAQEAQEWIEKSAQNGYPEAIEVLKRMGVEVTPIRKPEATENVGIAETTRTRGILSNVFISVLLLGITLWIVCFVCGLGVLNANSNSYGSYAVYKDSSNIREEAAFTAFIVALIGMGVGLVCMLIAYHKPKVSSFVYVITIFVLVWVITWLAFYINTGFSYTSDVESFWVLTFAYILSLIIIGAFIKLSKSKKPIIKF